MTIVEFPPVEQADEHGLLAIGGDLEISSLVLAYRNGIFLWPFHPAVLAWFAPPERAVLFFDRLHFSKSLLRERKRTKWHLAIDADFRSVISNCAAAKNRRYGKGTWITPEMIDAYTSLQQAGYAHSFECYEGTTLIGGVYGVSIGAMFAAESMFYRKPNASKLALAFMVETLSQKGLTWIDVQVMNPFTQKLGAVNIPRDKYQEMLQEAVEKQQLRLTEGKS
jgi:leucyl/phenylalanyl-tRNA---protein transferase